MSREIKYLGHIISKQGIRTDPDKVIAVLEFPVPTDLKQTWQFLGLSNYYRRFIKGYSSIAEPLHKLTSKSGEGYQWNQECQNAFVSLKQK